jgi:hypothetical protein
MQEEMQAAFRQEVHQTLVSSPAKRAADYKDRRGNRQ